jgi:hypothetical protein
MASDIEELRYEYNKIKDEIGVEQSIKFSRKMLMACVSGAEFLNHKFDPFDLKLDGWSESVMESLNDYDEVFEELYYKYKEKVQVAPEIRLLMMVGGSGFMFHLTNSLFKTSMPGLNDILNKNPNIMKDIQQAAVNSMSQSKGGNDPLFNMMSGMNGFGASGASSQNNAQQTSSSNNQGTKFQTNPSQTEMKGPSGVDDILEQLNIGDESEGESIRNIQIGTSRKQPQRKKREINIDF